MNFLQESIRNAVARAFITGYARGLGDASGTIADSTLDDAVAEIALGELAELDDIGQWAHRAGEYMATVELPNIHQLEFQFQF